MKFAFLVAFREYAENAKTKGFWLGILLVPLIIFFSVQVPIWLEKKGTPTRHFVLVDQSKTLAPIIEAKLERSYQGQVFAALKEYGRKYADPGNAPGSLDEFISSGGQSNYLAQLQSRLKPGAPPFKPPRRAFQMAPLPDGLNADAEIATLAQELKPYLRGERQAEVEGQKVSVAAAILIPRDIDQQIRRPKDKSATGQGIEYWAGNLADTQANWRRVRAIRIGMIVRGPVGSAISRTAVNLYPLGPSLSSSDDAFSVFPAPADGRLRQEVTFTVHLRNYQGLGA